jgi:hypothetical protein
MSIEELISELNKYPPHFEVEVFLDGAETGDKTAEISGVFLCQTMKVVSIELATDLMPE